MKIEDWVVYQNNEIKYIGFIVNIYEIDNKISIRISEPKELRNKSLTVDAEDLTPLTTGLHQDDLLELIDMCLLMKDKVWFEELLTRRTQVAK